jgi:hypothetical protein
MRNNSIMSADSAPEINVGDRKHRREKRKRKARECGHVEGFVSPELEEESDEDDDGEIREDDGAESDEPSPRQDGVGKTTSKSKKTYISNSKSREKLMSKQKRSKKLKQKKLKDLRRDMYKMFDGSALMLLGMLPTFHPFSYIFRTMEQNLTKIM